MLMLAFITQFTHNLGLQLDVLMEKTDAIEAQHLDPEKSLQGMLYPWLQLDM